MHASEVRCLGALQRLRIVGWSRSNTFVHVSRIDLRDATLTIAAYSRNLDFNSSHAGPIGPNMHRERFETSLSSGHLECICIGLTTCMLACIISVKTQAMCIGGPQETFIEGSIGTGTPRSCLSDRVGYSQ